MNYFAGIDIIGFSENTQIKIYDTYNQYLLFNGEYHKVCKYSNTRTQDILKNIYKIEVLNKEDDETKIVHYVRTYNSGINKINKIQFKNLHRENVINKLDLDEYVLKNICNYAGIHTLKINDVGIHINTIYKKINKEKKYIGSKWILNTVDMNIDDYVYYDNSEEEIFTEPETDSSDCYSIDPNYNICDNDINLGTFQCKSYEECLGYFNRLIESTKQNGMPQGFFRETKNFIEYRGFNKYKFHYKIIKMTRIIV